VAVVDYDKAAEWGLQDPRALLDPAIVEVNRGIGLADTIVMLPLFIVATIGLLRRRFYGAVASWLVFGMTLYWPVVYWCSQGFYAASGIRHQPTSIIAVVLPGALLLIAIWGSWYLSQNRELLQ
jgi:apolipoprotein N-acyltransferase